MESVNILDHIDGTVEPNLMAVTYIEYVPPNTAVAELGEAPTTAEAASSAVPHVPPAVIFWEFAKPIILNGMDYKSRSYHG